MPVLWVCFVACLFKLYIVGRIITEVINVFFKIQSVFYGKLNMTYH